MEYGRGDLINRIIAALIDGMIGWVFIFIPFIGGLISFLYILFKDGLMYELTQQGTWKNRSIGKKITNLKVVRLDGGRVDLVISARRNLPLTIGSIIAIIPLVGWILGGLVGMIVALIEILLVVADSGGRRIGDRWANTQVIDDVRRDGAEVVEIENR